VLLGDGQMIFNFTLNPSDRSDYWTSTSRCTHSNMSMEWPNGFDKELNIYHQIVDSRLVNDPVWPSNFEWRANREMIPIEFLWGLHLDWGMEWNE
jgi:hypothetical protein